MRHIIGTLMLALAVAAFVCPSADGQKKMKNTEVAKALEGYFTVATDGIVPPDSKGFIRRWTLLEPISKINNTNRVFTDSYTRDALMHEYFPGQFSVVPKDGDHVSVVMDYQPPVDLSTNRSSVQVSDQPKTVKSNLYWHSLDSDHFYVKLFRFATNLEKTRYGVIFWYVTVINCDEDIEDVRLAVGSNCGSMWWLNDEELLLMATDRHMGVDSAVSKKVTLKKGRNVLRGATINGIGMSEFCARFVDDSGHPITNFTISCN